MVVLGFFGVPLWFHRFYKGTTRWPARVGGGKEDSGGPSSRRIRHKVLDYLLGPGDEKGLLLRSLKWSRPREQTWPSEDDE